MSVPIRTSIAVVLLSLLMASATVLAQSGKSVIRGRVTDSAGGVLQGATVTLAPDDVTVVTDKQGAYSIAGLPPGAYTVEVHYLGFDAFTKAVEVAAGAEIQVDATLSVAGHSEEVLVSSDRLRGEAEDINRQRTSDNVVQVLSSDVITSLPNANIADAVGRLPSVTLERDEGEGKYVQIRGTEPRLSNTTVDGVNLPSPESGVRQIKLDTVASDLVDSVEINKTLQANMDGDGIGGSVNMRTKTAADRPTAIVSAMGGYTPIIGGRAADQFSGTIGRRFGSNNQLGVLLGSTYDYNGRGINDIEPSPTVTSVSPHYDSIDLRDYRVLPHALGPDRERGLSTQQLVQHLRARAVFRIPELGPEGRVQPERRRRAVGEHRLAAARNRGLERCRRGAAHPGDEVADLERLDVTRVELGRERRGEVQMEWRRFELRR